MPERQRTWPGVESLADHLSVHHGEANTGILRDGRRALLIDCGSEDILGILAHLGIDQVDRLLLTHHHRDQAIGAHALAASGARIGVPEAERPLIADVERLWADPAFRWHRYNLRPHTLVLPRSLPVHETYGDGDLIRWGTAIIRAIETPGHTDGSLSYLVDLGSEGRFLFCGDAIYGDGRLPDLYSLQKGQGTRDYHGFLGDRDRLLDSLDKLCAAGAAPWIPAHGPLIADPRPAVERLRARLEACYTQYAAISALRYYFPALFAPFDGHPAMMPIRPGRPYPDFLRHIGTSWMIISEDGAVFVLDCGEERVVRILRDWQAQGKLGPVEGLWITHYHDDHVDAVPQFREAFGCPVIADEWVARVIERPLAWNLPCLSPLAIPVDRRTCHGETWTWHEFTLTAFHLPGQTLYHGGLLVEGRSMRLLFAGDSFTPAGIDDYCPQNRNPLGEHVGFDAALRLAQELSPDMILNAHVDEGFDFNDVEYAQMRANLAVRVQCFGKLVPWDHPNYGLDDQWVRCDPYEQIATPGEKVELAVIITNYAAGPRRAICRPILPEAWGTDIAAEQVDIAPGEEGRILFAFAVPGHVQAGRWVVPVEVAYDGRPLGPFREAILAITAFRPQVAVAQMEDIPAWLALAAEVEPLFGPMVNDPAFRRALEKNIARGTAFCVREANGPPGVPLLGGLLLSPKPPRYTIGWLAVTQQHRRRGIGQSLVKHVLGLAESPAEFIVTTFGADHPAGAPARRFYEQMGFQAAEPAPNGPEGGSRQIFRRRSG